MELFDSKAYMHFTDAIRDQKAACEEKKRTGDGIVDSELTDAAQLTLQGLESFCEKASFSASRTKSALSVIQVKHNGMQMTYSEMLAELRGVEDVVFADFWQRKFVALPQKYNDYINNEKLLGEDVAQKFKEAVDDIREAGNCIAIESGTAAVFHLMRATEWGLRDLCKKLGIKQIPKSKKPGNSKWIAIEYSQWERIFDEMQITVDAKISALSPGQKKQKMQESYYPLLAELRGFKDAWRNHVMHNRRTYSSTDAEAILSHVRRFLTLLSRL